MTPVPVLVIHLSIFPLPYSGPELWFSLISHLADVKTYIWVYAGDGFIPIAINDRLRVHVLLIDDHALFRRGLRLMLRELFAEAEVSEAESCAARWNFSRRRST